MRDNKRNRNKETLRGKASKFMKKVVIPAMTVTIMSISTMATPVFAADTSAVTKPLDSLKTLIIAVIGAVGVIILAKNVGQSFFSWDCHHVMY